MSLAVFGDEGFGEDLMDAVERYGYYLAEDGLWVNDEDPDTKFTDEQMSEWLDNHRRYEQDD